MSDPLDVAGLKSDLCTALSQQQVEQLALEAGEPGSTRFGPTCSWDYAEVVGNQVSVVSTKKFDNGLADIYARRTALGYFEESQVSGYPAVYAGKSDDRDKGICQLHVGLTNNFVATVFAQLSRGTDYGRPCEVAKMTAETVIKNLKGGS